MYQEPWHQGLAVGSGAVEGEYRDTVRIGLFREEFHKYGLSRNSRG